MDFVRSRHGNAVWHRVTGWEVCTYFDEQGPQYNFTTYHTPCTTEGYATEGPRTELITADHAPGRLCRRCAKGMEVAA